VFSRNSASSRAIPLQKQIDRVGNDPAVPVVFPAEQKGMQGGDEIENPAKARDLWMAARVYAVNLASDLGKLGVHKSVANRLLEPFMWHTVVVTATEWDGFWRQRCSPLAQPEIRVTAEAMKVAYDASTPVTLKDGEWHLPYVDDWTRDYAGGIFGPEMDTVGYWTALAHVSAARCAAVSYMNQTKQDIEADVARYEKLVSADPMHASPLEHPCTPRSTNVAQVTVRPSDGSPSFMVTRPRYGNFVGWHQLRYDVEVTE
jgi:hypothetical protein